MAWCIEFDVWSCVEGAISYRRLTAFIDCKYLEKLKAKNEPGEARRLTNEETHRERPYSYPCPD
jgi:predicted NAD-dependent protein-ADP-ribosyltransferase YbiA (DUF1768 family)